MHYASDQWQLQPHRTGPCMHVLPCTMQELAVSKQSRRSWAGTHLKIHLPLQLLERLDLQFVDLVLQESIVEILAVFEHLKDLYRGQQQRRIEMLALKGKISLNFVAARALQQHCACAQGTGTTHASACVKGACMHSARANTSCLKQSNGTP